MGKGMEKSLRVLNIFDCHSVAEYTEILKTINRAIQKHKPDAH